MKLPIIGYKNELLRKVFIGLLFLALLLGASFYFAGNYFYLVFALCLIISWDTMFLYKPGNILFESDKIIISSKEGDNLSINHSDITCLLIDHLKQHYNFLFLRPNMILKITVQYQEKEISFQAYQNGQRVKLEFVKELQRLYKKGIRVKEFDLNGNRCFLFKGNLSFNEIQEIKNEYNLTWY